MERVQLIVEYMDEEIEPAIFDRAVLKYRLPIINAYVLEVPLDYVKQLRLNKSIKAVYETTGITTQMNVARRIVEADSPELKSYTGRGVNIAILDTGLSYCEDFTNPRNRLIAFKDFVNGRSDFYDDHGHGTHVAGIACGNGFLSGRKYAGIAVGSNIIGIKVLDEDGLGNSADVLAGLQWVYDNKDLYNIRIVNMSVGTPDIGSVDPLVRAVEKIWDSGIVVVVAAGNNGPEQSSVTSPGISRKVITVGAYDSVGASDAMGARDYDLKAVAISGERHVDFSGRGPTSECIVKPDVLAPGTNIVSCLSSGMGSKNLAAHKEHIVGRKYLSLSGTSMSTPIVSGAIALLLEKYPRLAPDDVKYALKKSAVDINQHRDKQGWGLINIRQLIDMEVEYVRAKNI